MSVSLLPLLIWMGQAAAAEWGQFEYDFDADKKSWQEIQAQLPAPPKAETLHRFEVSSVNSHRYFLDLASLSGGGDGVVRYTMVIRTSGGAENVSFEGMRCDTGERKTYAFGRPGGEWSRNKYARWDLIDARSATSYHRELFFHYFCTVEGPADMKVIRHAIERGGIRRGGD
jgi:hypothetical protein